MKKNLLILFLFISANLFAQKGRLDFLDGQLRKGDLNALNKIAEYFDNKAELTEYLGYHIINTNESNVAKRLVRENSMFLDSEIDIDSTTTADFKRFLTENKNNFTFSNLANAFLITSFDKRKTDFEIIELTDFKWNSLNVSRSELLNLDWVKENAIDSLVNSRNPLVLLKTASVLLKNRYRFNEHHDNQKEIIDLIQLLTKSQIAVPNESGELSYHLDKEFYRESKINLLVFFVNNYKNYKWDEALNAFINKKLKIKSVDYEKQLFEMLSSENDSIAQNAFISLTKLDAKRVSDLSDQYRKADVSENYILPTFSYKFLKQLAFLTNYCKEKNINFEGSTSLKNQIQLLKTKLTLSERRQLEDKLINELTLDDITAFEYWSLIYENSWSLTYSAGRILDKFYSKKWQILISNPEYLETYLLKSRLFDDLGIIGFCNNYLAKFNGSLQQTISSILNLNSSNSKVQGQIQKTLAIAKKPIKFKPEKEKTWSGNTSKDIKDFKASYSAIVQKKQNSSKLEDDISFLLSQIKYSQIGEALDLVENLSIKDDIKFSFLESDFGFYYIGDVEEIKTRNKFIENYQKFSELDLYEHYLTQANTDITNSKKQLDFDKIYEILKYDINDAFVGGGGSTNDNGVYSVIKVLELTLKTTLGYPNKLCCSDNMYACNSRGRAMEWINYLKVNNHLKSEHNEPVSFAYD